MGKKNKIKNLLKTTALATIIGLTSCSWSKNSQIASAEDKLSIVASHDLICHLVETIAEDTIDLTCLIDGDRDPHTYRPTPTDLKAIEQAQLVVYGGYELEPKIIQLLEDKEEEEINKLALYESVVTEPIMSQHEHHDEEHNHDEEHDHEGHDHDEEHNHDEEHHDEEHDHDEEKEAELQPDAHVWHDVENVANMVELLKTLLLQINPAQAEVYLKNSVALTDELWQLNNWIEEQTATIPEGQKILVTVHNSLNYYVRAYEFTDYKSLQGLSPESSPTATQLRELATEVRQLNIPTIFAENTASDRVIRSLAREAGVKLSPIKLNADSLGGKETYIEMMEDNTCAIVNGLGGECKPN